MWIANHRALVKTDHYYRSTHAHDVSCHATWVNSRTTTVESNMKVSIIYTWLVKTLHNMLFLLHFLLFSSSFLGYFCTVTSLLSLSQCHQHWLCSALNSAKPVGHCGGPAALFFASSIVKKCHSYLPSTSIVSACDAWVSERAHKCKWVQIDIRDCDRHIHTYVRTMREFKALC